MGRRARGRREQKKPTRPNKRARYLGILTGMAAAAVVVVVLIVLSQTVWESDGDGTLSEIVLPTPRPADISQEGTTLGSADAPLTILEYSDFQCPYCRKAGLEIVPEIEAEYVATGKVRLVWKQFPIEGEESVWAAEAAECAAEQNAFWEYHDTLFLNRQGINVGTFVISNLKLLAKELGLDTEAFDACLDEGRYRSKVAADAEEARRREINGTPTFFVGQTKLVGAKPYSDFKTTIEDELAKLGETTETEQD
jgi:protein-disulfide isomerase